ncbi:MAG TPA: CPBP family intramembrane glutamic endopeptidase [Terriglobales bacterium]|nr:CPBP family intramembrane glutamic endopeptidase [Terriglobales bacterium]
MSQPESQAESNSPSKAAASPEFAVATQPSYAHTLFFGPDGLRPGWGLAFYVLAFLALQKVVVDLAWARDLGSSGLWSMMLEEFGSFLAAVIPAVVLARVERRSWKSYGLPADKAFASKLLAPRLCSGAVWGFAAITLLMLALYAAHAFAFGHAVLHGLRLERFATFWAAYFLLVGLFEEFLLRGYLQFTLARGIGFWPAAAVLSSTFGLIHLRNGGEQWSGALAAAFIGLFFCLTLRRTGNLWFAVSFHAAWDWGETFFYSVPDSGTVSPGHLLKSSLHGPAWLSGGSVGPEGSVLCFVVIALTWLAFDRMYPRDNARPAPPQATADSSSLRSSE